MERICHPVYAKCIYRVVNIALVVILPIVSAILFRVFFWQYSIPTLLSPGASVKSVNSNITVTERVKARTVVLQLR